MFVRSIKKLEKVSESSTFPVFTYHSKMSDEEKETQLSSWLSSEGSTKWMISTTALLHGVDYPRVDAVIFLQNPFGLYDFVQGAGRAGRSGQESLVAILHDGVASPLPDENPYSCREGVERIIETTACRRLVISEFMDGSGESCFQLPNMLPCDLCRGHTDPLIEEAMGTIPQSAPVKENTVPRSTPVQANPVPRSTPVQANTISRNPTPRPRPSTLMQTNGPSRNPTPMFPSSPSPTAMLSGFSAQSDSAARKLHGQTVRELMERFAGCFVCRIKSDDHGPCHTKCESSGVSGCLITKHRVFSCSGQSSSEGWMEWKRGFPWPTDVSRCYFCGFPNSVVTFGHKGKPSGSYPGICRFSDTAVAAAWHILHSPALFDKLRRELGFSGAATEGAFATWLTQYGSEAEDIRLLSVFSWVCRQYYPEHFRSS